jgi:hypothetical protein
MNFLVAEWADFLLRWSWQASSGSGRRMDRGSPSDGACCPVSRLAARDGHGDASSVMCRDRELGTARETAPATAHLCFRSADGGWHCIIRLTSIEPSPSELHRIAIRDRFVLRLRCLDNRRCVEPCSTVRIVVANAFDSQKARTRVLERVPDIPVELSADIARPYSRGFCGRAFCFRTTSPSGRRKQNSGPSFFTKWRIEQTRSACDRPPENRGNGFLLPPAGSIRVASAQSRTRIGL